MDKSDSDQDLESVELLPAFYWICQECGKNQYQHAIHVEMSAEDMQEVLEDLGIDIAEQLGSGEFLKIPTIVECKDCSSRFKVTCPFVKDEPDTEENDQSDGSAFGDFSE